MRLHLEILNRLCTTKLQLTAVFARKQIFSKTGKAAAKAKKRRSRQTTSTWFSPPYSQNVSTKIGRRFLTPISKHFPRNSELSKIFKTNTLRLNKAVRMSQRTEIQSYRDIEPIQAQNVWKIVNAFQCAEVNGCSVCNNKNCSRTIWGYFSHLW